MKRADSSWRLTDILSELEVALTLHSEDFTLSEKSLPDQTATDLNPERQVRSHSYEAPAYDASPSIR